MARFTVEQAFSRYVARTAPWLAATQKTDPLAHDFDIEIGYLYGRDAVHADPRTTRGMPGSRLPHYWLERGGARLSTHRSHRALAAARGSRRDAVDGGGEGGGTVVRQPATGCMAGGSGADRSRRSIHHQCRHIGDRRDPRAPRRLRGVAREARATADPEAALRAALA